MPKKEKLNSASNIAAAVGLFVLFGADVLYDIPGQEREAGMARLFLIIMSFVFLVIFLVDRNWRAEFKRNQPINRSRGHANAFDVE